MRLMRAAKTVMALLCVSTVAGCDALESVVPEPEGQGDLIVTAIQLADATGTQTAKAKVSTPMRFRVTVKNQGETTMPASVVRVNASSIVLGDIQVPELRPGREVTADGELILNSELLPSNDRSRSVSREVRACANATQTGVERNSSNNCLSTLGALLIVQPNFELDCGATAWSIDVAIELSSITPRCDLSFIDPSSVRYLDVTTTTLGAYVVSVQRLGEQLSTSFWVYVYNEDGTVISGGTNSGSGVRTRTFNASVPGRYYIATEGNALYRKTVTRQ